MHNTDKAVIFFFFSTRDQFRGRQFFHGLKVEGDVLG